MVTFRYASETACTYISCLSCFILLNNLLNKIVVTGFMFFGLKSNNTELFLFVLNYVRPKPLRKINNKVTFLIQ